MTIEITNVGTEVSFAENKQEIELFFENTLKLHRIRVNDQIFLSALELPREKGAEGTTLEDSSNTLVIIAGRAETEHKYAEFLYSLKDTNLRVIVCFVRGQGQSSTVLFGNSKCHIDKFRYYSEDITHILSYLDVGNNYKLLGFSLGGLISLDFIFSNNFKYKPQRVALIAPFLGIKQPLPVTILFYVLRTLCLIRSFAVSYTPISKEYTRLAFEDNYHSHSELRYASYHDYYEDHPNLVLHGPTFGFVKECIKVQRKLNRRRIKFNIPTLCLGAGRDHVVSTEATQKFVERHKHDPIAPIYEKVAHAYHDILNESDRYRNPALLRALDFLFNTTK